MTGVYSETIGGVSRRKSFSELLQETVDKIILHGKEGIDRRPLNSKGEPTGAEDTIYRDFRMDPKVFSLGVTLHESGFPVGYDVWANWMTNTRFVEGEKKVTFYQESKFMNEYAARFLGPVLRDFFKGKEVVFALN